MKILIDHREPLAVINKIKKHFSNDTIKVQELPCGDVWIDDLIIERKTIADLLASIADNRLFNQASEMRGLSEWCYIIIESPLIWYQQKMVGTDWHFRSVQGALLQVQELGVCISYCDNDDDFPMAVEWLWKRDKSKIVNLAPRKYGLPITVDCKILSAIPGIGIEKAEKLLYEFGSAMAAIECLTDNNCQLPKGIGQKIRKAAQDAFGLSNGEMIRKVKNEIMGN